MLSSAVRPWSRVNLGSRVQGPIKISMDGQCAFATPLDTASTRSAVAMSRARRRSSCDSPNMRHCAEIEDAACVGSRVDSAEMADAKSVENALQRSDNL